MTLYRQLSWDEVQVDQTVSTLLMHTTLQQAILHVGAGRDYMRGHHDAAYAREQGQKDIYFNTLFHQSLVDRVMTDWAGPASFIARRKIMMRGSIHPGDRVIGSGSVVNRYVDEQGRHCVDLEIGLSVAGNICCQAEGSIVLPRSIPTDQRFTPFDLLRTLSQRYADKPALFDGGRITHFQDLEQLVAQVAASLHAKGIRTGDRVATLLTNGLPMIALYYACSRLGAIIVPLNWRLAAPELRWCLDNTEPSILLISRRFAEMAEKTGAATPRVMVEDTPELAFGDFLECSAGIQAPIAAASDQTLIILHTSGTTGRPKGCMLSQRGQYVSTLASVERLGLTDSDRLLLAPPLFHVGGLGLSQAFLAAGASLVIPARDANTEQLHGLLSEKACTATSLAPVQLRPLLERQQQSPLALALRFVIVGGGMCDATYLKDIRAILKAAPYSGYGQTECGNFVGYLTGDEQRLNLTACARPLQHLQVRLVDEAGQLVAMGDTGELQVQGSSVMQGYWKAKQASEAAFTPDGWLRTGDLMRQDDIGLLHFTGRLKDLIKSGGENVYPAEVEQALLSHPAVAEACVFGVPDPQWNEAVKAVLVLHPDQEVEASELLAWCRERIAGYKRPRYLEFVLSITRDFNGKPDKKALAQRPVDPKQSVS
jgi:fatty-acyl-CoA synthase